MSMLEKLRAPEDITVASLFTVAAILSMTVRVYLRLKISAGGDKVQKLVRRAKEAACGR